MYQTLLTCEQLRLA